MFHKQHYGWLAIGLSNVDEIRDMHIRHLNEEQNESDRDRFYSVTCGGVHHPWEHKEYEARVAITADGMLFNESMLEERVQIFAKVEFLSNRGVYLEYLYPNRFIGWGFHDPVKSAAEILEQAEDFVKSGNRYVEGRRWIVVDKPEVPKYHRSLLGKAMRRVKDSFTQGRDFFQNPKAR
jgi:hypothetical protein